MKPFFLLAAILAAVSCSTGAPKPGVFASGKILLDIDFNSHPTGAYGEDAFLQDWNPKGGYFEGIREGRAAIVADEEGGNTLRILYPAGKWASKGGMTQWRHDLQGSFNELYSAYTFRMDAGFDLVKGGKLPGPAGGKGNTGGDRPDGYDGWSARLMWRGDYLVQYVYHPYQPDANGESMLYRRIVPGERYRVVNYIKMNDPGEHNGVIRGWLNGELVLERYDICFRKTDAFAIDQFLFSTFYGGGDSTWAPPKDNYITFDDFLVWAP